MLICFFTVNDFFLFTTIIDTFSFNSQGQGQTWSYFWWII